MGTSNRLLVRSLAAALAAAAVGAPVVQAAGPDDRPYYRGSTPVTVSSPSPDDRAFYRGGSELLAPSSMSPDDRPFARSSGEIAPARARVAVVERPGGFDWGDALMAGSLGLALALLGSGAILIAYRRRSSLGTA